MAKTVRIYSGLLSSPRGLEQDREAIRRAVAEVNRLLKTDGIQVDTWDWERDVRPTVGKDGQDVVNRQICNDADFAFVLIHDRIGSPTPRAKSGTVEEAEIILNRLSSGENVDLMVFFRRPSINLSADSLRQLQEVLGFRQNMESRGVFWKEYTEEIELEKLVRMYLPHAMRELDAKSIGGNSLDVRGDEVVLAEEFSSDGVEELGALDLEIIFQDSMGSATESLGKIAAAAEELTAGMGLDTESLTQLGLQSVRDPRAIRDATNKAVERVQRYNIILEEQIPELSSNLAEVGESMIKLIGMSGIEFHGDATDLQTLGNTIEASRKIVDDVVGSTSKQRDALAAWPRMTKELNVEKRRGVMLMDELSKVFEGYVKTSLELERAINVRLAS